MTETAQLMGMVAAHAVVGVSEGKDLTTPLLLIEKEVSFDRGTFDFGLQSV